MLGYLFGFRGRINRRQFWIFYITGLVILAGLGLGLLFTEHRLAGHSATNFITVTAALKSSSLTDKILLVGFFAAIAVFLYALLAQVVKRLHDRDKSAWWLVLYFGGPLAIFTASNRIFEPMSGTTINQQIGMITMIALAWLIGVWYVIEVMFLPGTPDENMFGQIPKLFDRSKRQA